jgi:hypothetical protein
LKGRIGLGNTKTKLCEGYASIVDCIEMTVEELKKHNNKHHANEFFEEYVKGRKTLFVWILEEVETAKNPGKYSYSTGSWCKITC